MSERTLKSDFEDAVRPILFDTGVEEWQYATHGGTAFVVSVRGRPYVLTCRHVFKDFDESQLIVFARKHARKGDKPAPIKEVCYPSSPLAAAIDTDVSDLCLIEFSESVSNEFFHENVYVFDDDTISSSAPGDKLLLCGALKEKTFIDPPDITIGYCRLELTDDGATSDPIMRKAAAQYADPEFSDATGISGFARVQSDPQRFMRHGDARWLSGRPLAHLVRRSFRHAAFRSSRIGRQARQFLSEVEALSPVIWQGRQWALTVYGLERRLGNRPQPGMKVRCALVRAGDKMIVPSMRALPGTWLFDQG